MLYVIIYVYFELFQYFTHNNNMSNDTTASSSFNNKGSDGQHCYQVMDKDLFHSALHSAGKILVQDILVGLKLD